MDNTAKKAEPTEQFKLIYQVDSEYRDVEAKVLPSYEGQ
jgi:hypothetical protein